MLFYVALSNLGAYASIMLLNNSQGHNFSRIYSTDPANHYFSRQKQIIISSHLFLNIYLGCPKQPSH